MARKRQPWVPLLIDSDGKTALPRRYAQSTSGLQSSQVTTPLDSRSTLIASDSPQVRLPYATLFKWPKVVSHRRAKSSRSTMDSDFQNSSSSIARCHHMVSGNAIPIGDLTKRLEIGENSGMEREELNEVRRDNLREYVRVHCDGKKAQMIKKLPQKSGNEAYWRAVLGKGKKSFSWQKARETEPALGLIEGELEVPNSQLRMDPLRMKSHRDELIAMIQRMQPDEHLQMLNHGAQLFRKRQKQDAKAKREQRV